MSAVYMEPRALEFIRAWPNVPEGLRPAYGRFQSAGLIWVDPNVDSDPDLDAWPFALRLTERGEALKEVCDGQTYNFFTYQQLQPIFPNGVGPDEISDADKRIFKDEIPQAGKRASREYADLYEGGAGLSGAINRLKAALSAASANRAKV